MDELKRSLKNVETRLHKVENAQSTMTRHIERSMRTLMNKSNDVQQSLGEVRGAFAGVSAACDVLWSMLCDHEQRLKAIEEDQKAAS